MDMQNSQAQGDAAQLPVGPDIADGSGSTSDSPTGNEAPDAQTQSPEGEQTQGEMPEGQEPTGEDDGSGDQNKPFHEHPRWKEREEQWDQRFNDQETRHTKAIEDLTAEFNKKLTEVTGGKSGDEKNSESAPTEVPAWFGGDQESWNKFVAWNKQQLQQVAEMAQTGALKHISEQSEQRQKAIEQATAHINSEVARIQADKTLNPSGKPIDKNRLYKTVLDNKLVDTNGQWNYEAGVKIMLAEDSAKKSGAGSDKKKAFAANLGSDKSASSVDTNKATTSEHFADPTNRPW